VPKIRLDQMPLDRRTQARGGQAIVNKREIDPNVVGEIKQRHGSEREAAADSALGLIAEGKTSYITSEQPVALTGNFTALFNLKWGTLAEEGDYPILTLRASTADSHYYQLSLNRTAEDLKFKITVKDGDSSTSTLSSALTVNSSGGIAVKRVSNALTVELNGTDIATDADMAADAPTGPFFIDLLGTVQGVNSFGDKPVVGTTHPILSNFKLDGTSISVSSGDDTSRVAGDYDYHWKLDGEYSPEYIPANTGTNPLLAIPSAPAIQNSLLRFNGTTGAGVVRHTPDLDYYFDTYINSPNAGTFGFYIKGTQAIETTRRDTVLIDYGDLCKLTILTNGKVSFVMNGQTATTASAQFTATNAEYAFEIFCGRVNDNLYVRSVVGGTPQEGEVTADNYIPFLDYSAIPNIFIGSESSAGSTKRFKGSISKVAMYPTYYDSDAGDSLAEFAFDLTTELVTDKSPKNRTIELLSHFDQESVDPVYAKGGITDASFVSVEGGNVLSASGPKNYNSKLTRQLSDEVSSSRLGRLSFLESGGKIHVANREKENIRTIGVPKPSTLVTQESFGGGALSGAYSYGYRYVSDLNTTGPIQRLDPIKTSESARVKLGGATNPDLSALGDTYLVTRKDSNDVGRLDMTSALSGSYPIELYSRCGTDMDTVNFKETIWHRGATGGQFHLVTESNALTFSTTSNWTMQYAFKYRKATKSNYTSLCGMGPNGNYWPNSDDTVYRNPDFFAYIDHGIYGGTGGRLVVGCSKLNKVDGSGTYADINSTYRYITFSDDAGYWEEDALYNMVFIKSGDKIRVHCKKYSNVYADETTDWQTFTGRTDMVNNVTQDNLFANPGDRHGPVIRSATGFAAGQVQRCSGYHMAITADGKDTTPLTVVISNFSRSPHLLREMNEGSVIFAYRVWEQAKTLGNFKSHGEDRFACISDSTIGKLNNGILIDLFPYVGDDETTATDVIALVDSSIPTGGGQKFVCKNVINRETFRAFDMSWFAGSSLAPRQIPLMCIGDVISSGTPFTGNNPAGKIFLSDIGNGSLVCQVGYATGAFSGNYLEGRWYIMDRVWNESVINSDNVVAKATLPFVNDWDSFNWISSLLVLETSSAGGDVRSLRLDSLVINGNQVFSSSIGGDDSVAGRVTTGTSTGFIWLGGDNLTTGEISKLDEEIHTGEFRFWDANKGPDPTLGTDYKYLAGRASEDELGNLRYYYKFQPGDVESGDIKDYGTATGEELLDLLDGATLNLLTTTVLTDVAFPDSSHEKIAYIDIFRTASVPINDYDTEEDVQTALDTARSVAQYFLARIPIGTTQFIDNSPDSALGEEADYLSGYIPKGIKSAFVWDSRLVIVDENNKMWPSEPGPFGWESFPNAVSIPNLDTQVTAAINVQGERNQAMVLILGKSSGTLLTGSPDDPISHVLGGGVGAENQRCLAHFNGIAFAYNGTLWAIQQGQAVDFGGPVQELLPTPANALVRTSAKLSSLFVIDKSTGNCLRYHFPTQQWTVEERFAASVGDLEDGTDAWVSIRGTYAKGNTSVYGDDVQDDTSSSNTNTINTSTKVFTTNPDLSSTLHTDMPVTIVDTAGNAVGTYITAVSGTSVTVNSVSGLTAGSSTAATIYFGAGVSGLLLDTGPMDVGDDSVISPKLLVDNLTGTGWEYAVHATKHPGDRDVLPTLTYTTMSTASGYRASGVRGRFQRVVIRNRKREAAQIPLLEIDLS